MNWFATEYFCICYDNARWAKAKKKKAPGRKIQNWESEATFCKSATHAKTSKLKIHLEIRSSCLGPTVRG